MPFLESVLHATNANYINIDRDRQIYTNHYNTLRDTLYKQLQQEPPFNVWLKGHKLGGSYGDNLKITKPDEFDLVIHLRFPENDRIIVRKDPRRPGNVFLDMTQVLNILERQEHHKVTYMALKKLVTEKNLLLENKLQDLIGGAVMRALNKMNWCITVGGKVSQLGYKRCGPAHTISINEPNFKYSVDFVPGIRMNASQNILEPEQLTYFRGTQFWEAIPKPLKPAEPNNVSFRASYYDAENAMLKNKEKVKDVVKFIKKFRDSKQNMNNLKSYYIKTLLLWQVKEKPHSYWQTQKLKDILIEMFRTLKISLSTSGRNGKLPFFWDPKLDMFATFTKAQRDEMFKCVAAQLYILEKADGLQDIENSITNAFSTRAERGLGRRQSNKNQTPQNQNPQQANPRGPQVNQQLQNQNPQQAESFCILS